MSAQRPRGEHGHIPVLAQRCVEILGPSLRERSSDGTGSLLVDATLGAAGHAEAFLTALPGVRLLGLDRDPQALAIAGQRLAPFGDRVALVRSRYDGIADALAEVGADRADGVLFDLGVSSMQLDQPHRGFSYNADAPLDMRMDPDEPLTAADVLNDYDQRDLARVLRDYGEERFAGRIAGYIVRRRSSAPGSRRRAARRVRRRGGPAAIRPNARSRRCASRSTASCRRCARRCPRRCTRCTPVAAWP